MDEIEQQAEMPDSPASFADDIANAVPPEPGNRFVRDRDVMLRYLEGQSIDDIAGALFLEPKRVKQILSHKYVREEMQRLATLANDRYVIERIDTLTIEALDKIRDTLRGANQSELQFKAAKEILDKNPLLKQKQGDETLRELGAGLGEAIITRLAQQDAERQAAAIDVTPQPSETKGPTDEKRN